MAKIINELTYNGQPLSIVSKYAIDLENELLTNSYLGSLSSIVALSGIRYMNYSINLSSTVKELHIIDLEVFSKIISQKPYIEKVFLPNATICEDMYFFGCSKLNEISAPSLQIIEDCSFPFGYCSSMSSLYFPKLKTINNGNNFLNNINNLIMVDLPSLEYCNCNLYGSSNKFLSLNLPNLKVLGPNCANIGGPYVDYLNLNELTTFLSSRVQFYCSSTASVSFPKLQKTTEYMFSALKVQELELPLVSNIGNSAFYANSYISSIYLPKCTTIANNAFHNCSKLETMYAPLLSSLGNSAFYNCYNLKSVDLGNISELGSTANKQIFFNCSSLSILSLPSTLTQLSGSYTFSNCINLSQIIINTSKGIVALGPSNLFANTPIVNSALLGYFGSIYVPNNRVEQYQTASGWSYFSDRITSIDNLPVL